MNNPTNQPKVPQGEIDKLIKLYNQKRLEEAAAFGTALAAKHKSNILIHEVLAASYMGLEDWQKSTKIYRKLLELNPHHTDAINNIGMALYEQSRFNEAIKTFQTAIKIESNFANAHFNLGNTLAKIGELEQAAKSYETCLKILPEDVEILTNYGNILGESGKFDRAIACYSKAVKIKPDYAPAYNNMGNVLQDKYEWKLAIKCYENAIKIDPDYPSAFNNLGNALQEKGDLEAAISSYRRAIELQPDFALAYKNLGAILQQLGDFGAAIKSYENAIDFNPKDGSPVVHKLFLQTHICDWAKDQNNKKLIKKPELSNQGIEPFCFLPLEDSPERHRVRAESYTKKKHKQASLTFAPYLCRRPKRMKIAYFSADFKQHPVSILLAKVLETHNRDLFEIHGYSIGPSQEDKMKLRLIKAFDIYRDVHHMSDKSVALQARTDEIDIAIDLTGYTQRNRSGIFAYRAAPIQINYLGYPGTMGAEFIDYIVADQNLIPPQNQKYYSEKPIYLPHHFQAQDDSLVIADEALSRHELGLPEKNFVFCCINNSYKITSAEFNIWMRLLKGIDGSVLWLLESNNWVKENLLKEAIQKGIGPDRLIFTKMLAHDKYLAQFRQADLFLDTFTYNAGATASNALWAGLPVLTKLGQGYTSRMAASLLISLELTELITKTKFEYENLALELATNSERLSKIRKKLAANRLSKPLFNTKLFTKHLEAGYHQAHHNYVVGNKPKTIYVEP